MIDRDPSKGECVNKRLAIARPPLAHSSAGFLWYPRYPRNQRFKGSDF
jgi:hypothetical protein